MESKTIYKKLELDKPDYYKIHLTIINSVMVKKLTPTEIDLLAQFMSLDGILAEFRFGPTAKKKVRETLDNMSQASLSNHIGNLLEKGFLYKVGDLMHINRLLIPFDDEQYYHFRIKRIIKTEVEDATTE